MDRKVSDMRGIRGGGKRERTECSLYGGKSTGGGQSRGGWRDGKWITLQAEEECVKGRKGRYVSGGAEE